MRILIVALLLLKANLGFAHLEQLFFLRGTLGGREIGMRLQREDDFWHGEYFFLNEKRNILLKGSCDTGSGCQLSAYALNKQLNKEEITEAFKISEGKEHDWNGTWVSGNKTLTVNLKPIDIKNIDHRFKGNPFLNKLDPYSYLRTADIEFSSVKKEKVNGITVQWQREKISGVQFLRIKKGLPADAIEKTNAILTGIHLSKVEGYFWCGTLLFKGDYKLKTDIKFLSKNILSLNTSTNSNCQGTGNEVQKENITIGIPQGNSLSLEDIFYAGKDLIPRVNSGEWFDYRYTTFGALMLEMLKGLYPEKFNASSGKCDFNKVEAWQFPEWHLEDDGLHLSPYFPDYLNCQSKEEFVIPFSELEPYRKASI